MKKTEKQVILIVEDVSDNIDVLRSVLTDYKIMVALNGHKALQILESGKLPDLILLDIMMPEMDGFEVCERIRAHELYKNIPIIFLTSKTEKDSLFRGFEIGGQDYLTKPFDRRELLARVKTQLELKMHKDKLEDLVNLRTDQLEKAYGELQALDEAKIEFLNMLSHEIRTPLNGILGYVELAKMESESESGEVQEFLADLDTSAKRLEAFSQRALLITSLRARNFKVDKTDVDVKLLLGSVLEVYKLKFDERNISVEEKYSSGSFRIKASSDLLTKIITEIFTNILLHSPKATKVMISIDQTDGVNQIEISDNGDGFSEKALENLFKPFGYGQQHIDRKIGLGLHFLKLAGETCGFIVDAGNKPEGGAYICLNHK